MPAHNDKAPATASGSHDHHPFAAMKIRWYALKYSYSAQTMLMPAIHGATA